MDIADPEPRNPLHRLANIFPLMEGDAFDVLVADIRANGLRDAITLYEDKILDGRNRYRACRDAGVEPRFESPDIDDPLAFVIRKNALRRHLNESQRSMAAAKAANMRQGERTDLQSKEGKSLSQEDAAKLFNVGTSSVQRAVLVIKHGRAELQQAVERGDISVSTAAEQVHAERAAKKAEEQLQAGAEGDHSALIKVAKEPTAESQIKKTNEIAAGKVSKKLAKTARALDEGSNASITSETDESKPVSKPEVDQSKPASTAVLVEFASFVLARIERQGDKIVLSLTATEEVKEFHRLANRIRLVLRQHSSIERESNRGSAPATLQLDFVEPIISGTTNKTAE
jgi:ParB-like chromosome segregation protein Spo0J